jgi:hypothetical protein
VSRAVSYRQAGRQADRQTDGRTDGRILRSRQPLSQFFLESASNEKRTTYNGREGTQEMALKCTCIGIKEIQQLSLRAYRRLQRHPPHCTPPHPDNRSSALREQNAPYGRRTTVAIVSVCNSSPNIDLLRNGKILNFIIGASPAVDILDAIFISTLATPKNFNTES